MSNAQNISQFNKNKPTLFNVHMFKSTLPFLFSLHMCVYTVNDHNYMSVRKFSLINIEEEEEEKESTTKIE